MNHPILIYSVEFVLEGYYVLLSCQINMRCAQNHGNMQVRFCFIFSIRKPLLGHVTGLRKNGLIAGLAKINFFPVSSSTAYAKYERYDYKNSRPFDIIAFLMFEENAFRVCC